MVKKKIKKEETVVTEAPEKIIKKIKAEEAKPVVKTNCNIIGEKLIHLD